LKEKEKLGAIFSSLAAPNVAPKISATVVEVVNDSVLFYSLRIMSESDSFNPHDIA
jgi:hypothetical protein